MNIYCGVSNKIPKGKKRGTMHECVKSKQVRFWGLNKIDPVALEKLFDENKGKRTAEATITKLLKNRILMTSKLKKIDEAIKKERDVTKKTELKNERKKIVKEFNDASDALDRERTKVGRGPKQPITKKQSIKKPVINNNNLSNIINKLIDIEEMDEPVSKINYNKASLTEEKKLKNELDQINFDLDDINNELNQYKKKKGIPDTQVIMNKRQKLMDKRKVLQSKKKRWEKLLKDERTRNIAWRASDIN
jgi:hypothetical protein